MNYQEKIAKIETKIKNKEFNSAEQDLLQIVNDERIKNVEDDKYIYLVITCTNADLTATQIIRYYEMRPKIEEDFRQLKDIWKICTFTSTKYVFVMCQICMTFLA